MLEERDKLKVQVMYLFMISESIQVRPLLYSSISCQTQQYEVSRVFQSFQIQQQSPISYQNVAGVPFPLYAQSPILHLQTAVKNCRPFPTCTKQHNPTIFCFAFGYNHSKNTIILNQQSNSIDIRRFIELYWEHLYINFVL